MSCAQRPLVSRASTARRKKELGEQAESESKSDSYSSSQSDPSDPAKKRPRKIVAAASAEALWREGVKVGDLLQRFLDEQLANLSGELADMGPTLRRQQEEIEGQLDALLPNPRLPQETIVRPLTKLKRAWDAKDTKEEEE